MDLRTLLFGIMLLSLSFCLGRSDFYYEPSESFSDWGHGCQVYHVDASGSVADVSIAKPTAAIASNKADSTISNAGWEIYTLVSKTKQVWTPDVACSMQDAPCDPKNVTGNQTCDSKTNTTKQEVCEDKGSYHTETYNEDGWLPMNSSQKFVKGIETKIRYCADYEMKPLSTGGWGASIDVIPSFNGYSYPEYAWWNTSWSYRAPCYVNTTVTSSLANFPAHCIIDTNALITAGKMNTSCQDLRVVSSSDSALNYEIENGTCNTTTTAVWLGIPATNATGNDVIYIYYGNPTAADGQSASALWLDAGYFAVYHANDFLDSTNLNNLTNTTSVIKITNVPGRCKYGNCWNWSAAALLAMPSSPTGYNASSGTMSVTKWAYRPGDGQNPRSWSFKTDATVFLQDYIYGGNFHGSTSKPDSDASTPSAKTFNLSFFGNLWNGTNGMVHKNGVFGSPVTLTAFNATSNLFYIGGYDLGADNWGSASGSTIDEMRFANVSRSNNWILAEYAQTDSIGAEEVSNQAPSVVSLNLTPTTAYTDTDLVAAFTINDSDSALLNATVYWYKNGVIQNTLNATFTNMVANSSNSTILSNAYTTPDESWSFAVNATDGSANSTLNFSSNVTILNRIPNTTAVLDSYTPHYDEDIECQTLGDDLDLDLLSVNISWFVNDAYTLSYTASGLTPPVFVDHTLGYGNYTVGDSVICQASYSDGYGANSTNTTPAVIQNYSWPAVHVTSPSDGDNTSSLSNTFTFMCDESETTQLTGELWFDSVLEGSETCQNGSSCLVHFSELQACDWHTFHITCRDDDGRETSSSDDDLRYYPHPYISSPANGSSFSPSTPVTAYITANCTPDLARMDWNGTNETASCIDNICSDTNDSRAIGNYTLTGWFRDGSSDWYATNPSVEIESVESGYVTTVVFSRTYEWSDFETYVSDFFSDWSEYILSILVMAISFIAGKSYSQMFMMSGVGMFAVFILTMSPMVLAGCVLMLLISVLIKYVTGV
jgi:hypothetical protein